ncbi:hypothetical protein ACA910_009516 [Epithemia clementina (nom. ined.)]
MGGSGSCWLLEKNRHGVPLYYYCSGHSGRGGGRSRKYYRAHERLSFCDGAHQTLLSFGNRMRQVCCRVDIFSR